MTISIALHTALSHLDKRNTYVRMLFIDYSSAFNNTIAPTKRITKLRTLGLNTSLCNWILNFLTGGKCRQQHIYHAAPQHWAPSGVCA
jgi:gmma-aminobutyric acid receptor subunit gamma/cGMP-dependent protein kinase 2